MKKNVMRNSVLAAGVIGIMTMTGCSSKQPVNFNIHTEPEGAHVVYRLDNTSWTYLGVTPLDVVEVLDKSNIKYQTVTLRTMRCGYLEQAKQWTGKDLLQENDEKGMIFWTPRLIKDTQ